MSMRQMIFWAAVGVSFVTAVLSSAELAWIMAGATHGHAGGYVTRMVVSLVIFAIAFGAAFVLRPKATFAE